MKTRTLAAILVFLPLFSSSFAADEKWDKTLTSTSQPTFPPPRPMKAKYGFSWSGIPGASADVRTVRAGDRLQFDGTIRTAGLIRSLWKFDGTHSSSVDAATLRPRTTKQTENLRKKKTVTNLSFDSGGVTSRELETPGKSDDPETRRFDFPEVFDLYSALLYLRSQPLEDQNILRIVVYPATSAYLATVTVAGRERFTGPTGSYDSIKLDLQLNKISKTRELEPHKKFRRATVWLSDDSDRLLLKIQAQIFVGTVLAELESVKFDEKTK